VTINPNDDDRFVLRQRIRLVINQYEFALTLRSTYLIHAPNGTVTAREKRAWE
jgi:hypothetical protein